MEQREVVFLEMQMLKAIEQLVHIAEAVGNNNHHCPLANALGKLMQLRHQPRFPTRLCTGQGIEDVTQVQRVTPGRNIHGHAVIENLQSHRISLMHEHIGKRSSNLASVIKLTRTFLTEGHALGAIDHHITTQVGVGLKFPNVISVCARQHPPVEQARIIAGHVFAVFGKLHTGAAEGAFVMTDDVAHHRLTCVQELARKPSQHIPIQNLAVR